MLKKFFPLVVVFSMHPSVNTVPLFITRRFSLSDPLEYGMVNDSSVHGDGWSVQGLADGAENCLWFCSDSLGSFYRSAWMGIVIFSWYIKSLGKS